MKNSKDFQIISFSILLFLLFEAVVIMLQLVRLMSA